jgi:hypothetical protein
VIDDARRRCELVAGVSHSPVVPLSSLLTSRNSSPTRKRRSRSMMTTLVRTCSRFSCAPTWPRTSAPTSALPTPR